MFSFTEDYEISIRYQCKYRIIKEGWGWNAECECRFLSWVPRYFPLDNLYRFYLSKGELIIQKGWNISEELYNNIFSPDGHEHLSSELLSILRQQALSVIRGFNTKISLNRELSDKEVGNEIKRRIQEVVGRLVHSQLFKIKSNPIVVDEPALVDAKPRDYGEFINSDPLTLFEGLLKHVLNLFRDDPFKNPVDFPYNYKDLEELTAEGF